MPGAVRKGGSLGVSAPARGVRTPGRCRVGAKARPPVGPPGSGLTAQHVVAGLLGRGLAKRARLEAHMPLAAEAADAGPRRHHGRARDPSDDSPARARPRSLSRRLDRLVRRNAQRAEMILELTAARQSCQADQRCRCSGYSGPRAHATCLSSIDGPHAHQAVRRIVHSLSRPGHPSSRCLRFIPSQLSATLRIVARAARPLAPAWPSRHTGRHRGPHEHRARAIDQT